MIIFSACLPSLHPPCSVRSDVISLQQCDNKINPDSLSQDNLECFLSRIKSPLPN